jgi:hypothetical protein
MDTDVELTQSDRGSSGSARTSAISGNLESSAGIISSINGNGMPLYRCPPQGHPLTSLQFRPCTRSLRLPRGKHWTGGSILDGSIGTTDSTADSSAAKRIMPRPEPREHYPIWNACVLVPRPGRCPAEWLLYSNRSITPYKRSLRSSLRHVHNPSLIQGGQVWIRTR